MEDSTTMDQLSRWVSGALENADLVTIGEYLDPAVHWGPPGDTSPPCQTKEQVLEWYKAGYEAAVRARVTEIVIGPDCLVVGLAVRGSREGRQHASESLRWQVLNVRNAKVVSIVGFDERADAIAHAGVA